MQQQELISAIRKQVVKSVRGVARENLATFTDNYFARVPHEDLVQQPEKKLVGSVISHLRLARSWKSGYRKIRIYNPDPDKDGWESDSTIVEIVTWNMPFLVDSITMELSRHGYVSNLTIHPMMGVVRNKKKEIRHIAPYEEEIDSGDMMSFIHAEIDRISDMQVLKELEQDINRVLEDVRIAVADWQKMVTGIEDIIEEVKTYPQSVGKTALSDTVKYLQWLLADHFTILGLRQYDLTRDSGGTSLNIVKGTGRGLLRSAKRRALSRSFDKLPEKLKKQAAEPVPLTLTKSNSRSTIHRPAYLDYVGVKRFDRNGKVIGEYRILGLYTSSAYLDNPRSIPVIKRKIARVIKRSGLMRGSHAEKALTNVLDTYPRDELLQASVDDLHTSAMGIVELQERQRVRLFVRRDSFDRYFACLVFVPKDRFRSEIRQKIQDILSEAFNGTSVDFSTSISESPYAQLYLVVHTQPGQIPRYNAEEIEKLVTTATHTWDDRLRDELAGMYGKREGARIFSRYCGMAFPASYQQDHTALEAVYDSRHIEAALADNTIKLVVYRDPGMPDHSLKFKLYNPGSEIPLSDALPILENMGLYVESQNPYEITPVGGIRIWVHDYGMHLRNSRAVDLGTVRDIFQDAFARIWSGEIENDGLNKLVLSAALSAREIMILRAYARYMRQIGTAFSDTYIENALGNHTDIVSLIVTLFRTRFDPDGKGDRDRKVKVLVSNISGMLDEVASLDEDRILRRFFELVQATLRTNYFQSGDNSETKPCLSLKLAPRSIPDLPLPHPKFEIFVYSPRVEGVHLRGGKVARGGLRWSDRREDFRTEILGLMKSQMVKNAVIVPVGAKGGFYVKQPPAGDRAALLREGIDCYRIFIRGLLDITDNRKKNRVTPPPRVVRYDDDDPYLVVAADKGTATFSDIANQVSAEYGFWLGDAFASGGSAGYDHKKMGITARGAWESVKHHFQIEHRDTQKEPFTVIAIGDMSGDVFGNGMLLSKQIRLLGAFNHMHIFLDPDPDCAQSFQERNRLFRLNGSTWGDYNSDLISRGGGVYSRSLKSITLSAQVREMLNSSVDRIDPAGLIKLMLAAPVDMIWNGGIGTYIKSSQEHHAEVGDKANDSVRINANELRCRVIGEGGNLGITQRGRLEFAANGGRINADWIDNSGGVHCSDREVNIKILLNDLVNRGELTLPERNRLLRRMTSEVARLVLQDNYRQARAITATQVETRSRLGWYMYLLLDLDQIPDFSREQEQLPDHLTIDKRRATGEGLGRPEIATILAYTKSALAQEVLKSDLPDEPYLCGMLERYFPYLIRETYAKEIRTHQLRREIIATLVTNSMVNRAGVTFAHRMTDESGATIAEITRAYLLAREVFSIHDLWPEIDRLDNRIAVEDQMQLVFETQHLLRHAVRWFLRRNEFLADVSNTVQQFRAGVEEIGNIMAEIPAGTEWDFIRTRARGYRKTGVPARLANRFAVLRVVIFAPEIIRLASAMKLPLRFVCDTFISTGSKIRINDIHTYANTLATDTIWQDRARTELLQDLIEIQGDITAEVLRYSRKGSDVDSVIEAWYQANEPACRRYFETLGDFQYSETVELAMLSVILGKLRNLL